MKTNVRHHKNGFVLITVLLVIVLLASLLLEVNYASRTALSAAGSHAQRLQAVYQARTGLNHVIATLRHDPDMITNLTLRNMLTQDQEIALPNGVCRLHIESENAKINVNQLLRSDGQPEPYRTNQFLRLIDAVNQHQHDQPMLSYALVPSLIDWIDSDEDATILTNVSGDNSGAESSFYESLDGSYQCSNKPMNMISEMRLIKGVAHKSGSENTNAYDRLKGYVTTYGDGKIDINTASPVVLKSLSDQIPDSQIAKMISVRAVNPFMSLEQLRQFSDLTDDMLINIEPYLVISPPVQYITVVSEAQIQSTRSTVKAVLRTDQNTNRIDMMYYKEY